MDSTRDAPRGADPARLRAIRRHLGSFLPAELAERFWHEGFATSRQPSFRINALRLSGATEAAASSGTVDISNTSVRHPTATPEPSSGCGGSGDVGSSGGGGETKDMIVRQLLEGFSLPYDTPVERCPYHPLARLLPASTASVVRVAEQSHALGPLRRGSAYFMGLSSMLPALALMAHTHLPPQPPPPPPQQQQTKPSPHQPQPQRQPPRLPVSGRAGQAPGDDGVGGGAAARAPPLRVLDLCAAPGGKTALLAQLMCNRGTLLAVDASWPRLQRLQFNVDRLVPNHQIDCHNDHNRPAVGGGSYGDGGGSGGTRRTAHSTQPPAAGAAGGSRWWRRGCVVAVHADGTQLRVDEHGLPLVIQPPRYNRSRTDRVFKRAGRGENVVGDEEEEEEGEIGLYDRVLVDAPCSGTGRLQLCRPSSYNRWDEDAVAGHPERQRALLLRGARLLRRGGSLVYSTCTLDPRENEEVVAWLLDRTAGSLRLVQPRLIIAPAPAPAPASASALQAPVPEAHASAAAAASASVLPPGHGSLPAVALHVSVPLREALEAHRPGCTYDPLLEGPWWDQVLGGGAGGDPRVGRGGSVRGKGSHAQLAALGLFGGAGQGGRGGAAMAELGTGARPLSREALRAALGSCCVRVAPGPSYEGFFLAQFVRE